MDIKTIKDNYDKAMLCFYTMGRTESWHRDDLKGWHYLLDAYYGILETEITDHLLYARILKVLAYESRFKTDDYEIMNKYLKESKKHFEIALKDNNDETAKKDYDYMMEQYTYTDFELKNTSTNVLEEDCFKLIKNNEILKDFYFGDGVIKSFNIDRDSESIIAEFQNYHQIATFKFSKVYDIKGYFDIRTSYIQQMFLYKTINNNHLQFDIEFLSILCDEIEAIKGTSKNIGF